MTSFCCGEDTAGEDSLDFCRVGTAVDAPGLLMKSGNGAGAATFGVNFVPAGVSAGVLVISALSCIFFANSASSFDIISADSSDDSSIILTV